MRLSVLCESQTGYRNLSQLITGYKLRQKTKGEGVATLREVRERCEGLVSLTGGDEGPLAGALQRGGMDEGRRLLRSLVQTFGPENVYVERHRIREQEARNEAAVSLAHEFRLPVIATNGVNMATALEREVLDVLTTIRHHTSLDAAGLLLQHNANRYLRSAQEVAALYKEIPQAIAETRELSSRLQFEMKDMGYQFPLYAVGDDTMDSFLYKRTMEGVLKRYGAKSSASLRKRAEKQVARELALIAKLGLAGYFLIVWDIVEFCRKKRHPCTRPSSAANSAVCYALGITAVDPVGGWSCSSSDSCPRCAESGQTSTWTSHLEKTARRRSSMSIPGTASWEPRCVRTSSPIGASRQPARRTRAPGAIALTR